MKESERYKSSKYTASKQQDLAYCLDLHMRIVKGIFKEFPNTYLYYDLNAGKGIDPKTGLDGSPWVFLNTLAKFRLDAVAHFYEKDPGSYAQLSANILARPRRVMLHCEDHNAIKGNLKFSEYQYGLVYTDPSNYDIPVELLTYFNTVYPRTDIMIHIGATSIKRVIGIDLNVDKLDKMLHAIGKEFWHIRDSHGRNQWTMLFGTNWDGYPELKSTKTGRSFHRIDTPYGRDLLNRLSLNSGDYNDLIQPGLL